MIWGARRLFRTDRALMTSPGAKRSKQNQQAGLITVIYWDTETVYLCFARMFRHFLCAKFEGKKKGRPPGGGGVAGGPRAPGHVIPSWN